MKTVLKWMDGDAETAELEPVGGWGGGRLVNGIANKERDP